MSDHRSLEIDRNQRKLGPIWLSPGILPRNVLTLFYSGAMAIGFVNLLNLIQPLLLQENLGMTSGEGDFTANLYIVTEITTLLVAAPLANLSDQTGRRPILTSGFLILCLGILLISTASSGMELMLFRIVTSVGIACCTTMIASLCADYPQNASRGKLIGTNGVFTAIGVIVIGSGLTQLPKVFVGMGYTPVESTSYALLIGGGLAFLTAFITFAGIRKGPAAVLEKKHSFMENARIGLAEINRNPKLLLGCGATALSRGDLTVLASFFALWIQKTGADKGIESVVSSATAGKLFGLTQVVLLLAMPVIAIVVDRIDRVTNLCLAIALAAIGYFALGFAPDPFDSPLIYLVIVLAGIGEAVMIISVPALIGQEAPAKLRGAIIGVAATFGALGIIVTNKTAGYLFDNWDYQGPFLFMGMLNSCMLIWALTVRANQTKSKI
jgi:MFS family permease